MRKNLPQVPSNKESPLAKDLGQLHSTAQKEKIKIRSINGMKQAYLQRSNTKVQQFPGSLCKYSHS